MILRLALGIAIALIPLGGVGVVCGEESCVEEKKMQAEVEAQGGRWSEMSIGQYHFLEGIYAMNPLTPEGLPPGTGAVFASDVEGKKGMIFWKKGSMVCSPMPAPEVLMDLVKQIATGKGEEL